MIEVINPGLLTTVQDRGRVGYEQYGVSQSGAMDLRALQAANVLVGNDPNEAGLEITAAGPTLLFHANAAVAVTGAHCRLTCSSRPVEDGRAICIRSGDSLQFLSIDSGCRAYLAVAGGLDIPKVLGSCSTSVKHGIGGFQGRRLEKGDLLRMKQSVSELPALEQRCLPDGFLRTGDGTVRVILGPQEDRFTEDGIRSFLQGTYTVGQDSDRMGYRLTGPSIRHVTDGNIISDGIAFGSVQVPTDGQPIIMMADRQTVGGYAKIATVISADLGLVAQCRPGDLLRFKPVTLAEAQSELRTWVMRLDWLDRHIRCPEETREKYPRLACSYTVELEKEIKA